jgi:hypothetical protein
VTTPSFLHPFASPATFGELLELTVSQRHQSDLGSREQPADEDEQEDQKDVDQGFVHRLSPPIQTQPRLVWQPSTR